MRLGTLLWAAFIVATVVALYQVEQEVRGLEERFATIDRQVIHNREAIHILQAEWSYLNDPRRLGELARRYLELAPVIASQLVRFADLPRRLATAGAVPPPYRRRQPAPAPMAGLDPETAAVLAAIGSRQ